jgi:hypothetical protein
VTGVGRRTGPALAGVLLAVVALTGCRGAGQAIGGGSGDAAGVTPAASTQAGGAVGAGAGSSAGTAGAGPAASDPAGIQQDLSGLASVDSGVGSELDSAASDAAQADNG